MDSDSEASSAPSPSPPASPVASFHGALSVEQLIQHFVAAKRALSSTSYVFRANELVTSSRTLVEEIAVLNAKNEFARRGVDEQVGTLGSIKDGIVSQGDGAGDEFGKVIERLDRANDRLQGTLKRLRGTVVDSSLQRKQTDKETHKDERDEQSTPTDDDSATSQSEIKGEEQTLYSFIDETNHTTLQSSLRSLIDSYNEAREDMDTTIQHFEESLTTIHKLLSHRHRESSPANKPTLYDADPPPTLSHLFHGMEDHAAEMAALLQSLISHYDLCVTALKHTEGGGEAAKRAIQSAEGAGFSQNQGGAEESLYLKSKPAEDAVSDDERKEMLRVLETDAHEVEDVVSELKDRNREQEDLFSQLSSHATQSRQQNQSLRQVLEILHEMHAIHLPSHTHALSTFLSTWLRIRSSIESQTAQLASLSDFYDSFLTGYAKLLREIERRAGAEQQMQKVAEKANRELERLWEADGELREQFMEDVGQVLPAGIWDGIAGRGRRWEVREVFGDDDG